MQVCKLNHKATRSRWTAQNSSWARPGAAGEGRERGEWHGERGVQVASLYIVSTKQTCCKWTAQNSGWARRAPGAEHSAGDRDGRFRRAAHQTVRNRFKHSQQPQAVQHCKPTEAPSWTHSTDPADSVCLETKQTHKNTMEKTRKNRSTALTEGWGAGGGAHRHFKGPHEPGVELRQQGRPVYQSCETMVGREGLANCSCSSDLIAEKRVQSCGSLPVPQPSSACQRSVHNSKQNHCRTASKTAHSSKRNRCHTASKLRTAAGQTVATQPA